MRLDSSGRLGLGTSSPSNTLHVVDSSSQFVGTVRLGGGSGSSGYYATIQQDALTTGKLAINAVAAAGSVHGIQLQVDGTSALAIDASRRVGIGTTTPDQPMTLNAANGYPVMSFQNNGTTVGDIGFNVGLGMVLSGRSTNPILFYTNSSERGRWTSDGKFLVGTSSARSNVYTGANLSTPFCQIENSAGNYDQGLSLLNYSADGYPSSLTLGVSLSGTKGTNTLVRNNEMLGRINFAGNDGTNFRSAALIEALVDGFPGSGDMPGRLVFSTTADGASSPTERMRITNDGVVNIGTSGSTLAPSTTSYGITLYPNNYSVMSAAGNEPLTLNRGNDGFIMSIRRGGTVVGSIQVTTSSTSFNTSSDYRLKENVVPLIGAVDRLNQLQVHRFNFIADPGKTVDGFIAHEAQAVVPECVTGEKDAVDDDGNPVYQGIDQSKLVPLLTAALQEALGRIETLEAKVAALEGA